MAEIVMQVGEQELVAIITRAFGKAGS